MMGLPGMGMPGMGMPGMGLMPPFLPGMGSPMPGMSLPVLQQAGVGNKPGQTEEITVDDVMNLLIESLGMGIFYVELNSVAEPAETGTFWAEPVGRSCSGVTLRKNRNRGREYRCRSMFQHNTILKNK